MKAVMVKEVRDIAPVRITSPTRHDRWGFLLPRHSSNAERRMPIHGTERPVKSEAATYMTQAQAMMSALVMLSHEAIDLYIISEDLHDVAESEMMLKDLPSLWLAVRTIESARRR